MTEYAIELSHITKVYKNTKAVNDLSIHVPKGKVYGFIGKNGAGKTTTLRMIMGLITPNSGDIYVNGKSVQKNKLWLVKNIGAIIENPGFYENLSAKENLSITATLFETNKKRIAEVLEIVGLDNIGDKKAKNFSLGMKQRLGIANALVHSPEILILDEPTNGLDPAGIRDMRQLLKNLSHKLGITIIISSHILSEIQQICDFVGIIDNGKLIKESSIDSYNMKGQKYLILEVDDIQKTCNILKIAGNKYTVENQQIKVYCNRDSNNKVNELLVNNKINVYNLSSVNFNLEELFLEMTKEMIV